MRPLQQLHTGAFAPSLRDLCRLDLSVNARPDDLDSGTTIRLDRSSAVHGKNINLVYVIRSSHGDCFAKRLLAPILDNFVLEPIEYRFNGTLDWPSPYRGPPNPSVDAAWEQISICMCETPCCYRLTSLTCSVRPLDISLSKDQLITLGTDPDTVATNAPEHGGGYFLLPEFSHQLHCVVGVYLDSRQAT
jgi:hypothetical protein